MCVASYIEDGAPEGDEVLGDRRPGREQDVIGVGVHPGTTERSHWPHNACLCCQTQANMIRR